MAEIVSKQLKIGMEVHVELATRSKMFTRSAGAAFPENYEAEPNTLCDPLVLALPGALPVLNMGAIEMSMKVGMALGCRIADFTKWDRKNYFYPDLPKGYQISQYDEPLCLEGVIEIPSSVGGTTRIGITRAHLEEDTGKTGHELPGGHPYEGRWSTTTERVHLLEIVTEPDFTTAEDCVTFGRELRNICRFLGVTEGIMQKGHMRFEPNINMELTLDDGRTVATPVVEVKNLNSFRAVLGDPARIRTSGRGLEGRWSRNGSWNEIDQRLGRPEAGHGSPASQGRCPRLSYFPDPDLLPVVIDEAWKQRVGGSLPELPMIRRQRYRDSFGLSEKDAAALTEERDLCFFFESCAESATRAGISPAEAAQQSAKWILNAGVRIARERDVEVDTLGITPDQIAGIISLRASNAVGSTAAAELFTLLCDSDDTAEAMAESKGLLQVSDTGQLDSWIDEAIGIHPQAAEDFAQGKDAAMGRIMGHIMKVSGGQADAKMIRERLIEKLRS